MTADFEDGKADGALRTIGEVSEALGIKSHVLRYWEGQFPQLQPMKRSGGRRYYRTEDVALVREIDRLVNKEGYTVRGAKSALKDFRGDEEAPAAIAPSPQLPLGAPPAAGGTRADTAAATARLRSIRATLAEAIGL